MTMMTWDCIGANVQQRGKKKIPKLLIITLKYFEYKEHNLIDFKNLLTFKLEVLMVK